MKKILFFLILGINYILSFSLDFSVVPTRFEINLEKMTTNEIYVTNNTSEPMKLEAYIEGDKGFGTDFNINDDIVIFPKKIFIKPAGRQIVRFRVKPNSKYSSGEYKSYIVFKEVPYEIKATGENLVNGSLTNVSLITEIGIPVYGSKGELIIENRIEKIDIKRGENGILVNIDLENLGNTSSKFSYEIISKDVKKENSQGKLGMSMREGKSRINTGITIPEELKGKKFKFIIKDQNEKIHFDKII